EIAQENSRKGTRRHAQALFGAGMLRLHPDLRLPDPENASETLQDLDKSLYDKGGLHVAAFVALALADDARKAREENKQLRDSVTRLEQSGRTEKEEWTKQLGDAQAELQKCHDEAKNQASTVERLEREKSERLVELEGLRADIAA